MALLVLVPLDEADVLEPEDHDRRLRQFGLASYVKSDSTYQSVLTPLAAVGASLCK
jgi:hypothetical protein